MAEFEVLQVEARTGDVIATLPVTGAQYSDTVNAPGAATVGMPLDAADPDTLECGRSGLVVLRDGEPDWGGMLWAATADLAQGTLTLSASGWHSYYSARYLDMPTGFSMSADKALLIRAWIEHANENGGIGTDASRVKTGGARTRKWGFAEFKNIAEAIGELADEPGGFEFWYETRWLDSRRSRIGNAYQMASRLSRTFPTLTHLSNAEVVQVGYDGTKLASQAVAFGADIGTGVKPYHIATNELVGPAMTQVVTYSDLKATADLVPKAGALAAVGRRPIAIPTLNLYPGVYDPALFPVGAVGAVNADAGYVRLLEEYVLTERRISVDANGTEAVSLSLANKEVFSNGDSG